MRTLNRIVIHCSATRKGRAYSKEQVEADHIKRGYSRCGYHFYITTDGHCHPMRPLELEGAHAKGYNVNSIGICYEGGLDEAGQAADTRTPEQRKTLQALIEQLKRDYPITSIVGHRDLSPDRDGDGVVESDEWVKLCPCFDVKTWLRSLIVALALW